MTPREFSIGVTFLTGYYHGEEWPPSSARLYQALVAGLMTCGYAAYADYVEPALRWLERQPPPQIRASAAIPQRPYRIAVPNNDMDVVALSWASGRHGDSSRLRTMKTVTPREVQGQGPHVQYVWSVDGAEAQIHLEPLRLVARRLHTLGWGVDMAYADVREPEPSTDLYEPATSGQPLAAPMEGTWDDLHATYLRFQMRARGKGADTDTRPSMLRLQPYRRRGEVLRPWAGFMLMTVDGSEPKAVPWRDCIHVAAWLRHAAAQQLKNEFPSEFIQEYIQGHTKPGERSRHLSYVPLPTIYMGYGAGAIRRAIIVEPPDSAGDIIRLLRLKLGGCILTGIDGNDVCSLEPAPSDDWTIHRDYGLHGSARVWRSVTPVVLHGFNAGPRGRISVSKTERLLFRAFEMAGYPEELIDGFAFQAGPLVEATGHSSAIRVPDRLDGYPRLHVEVRFRQAVSGPVLAGIGRHYGIGLFAPVDGA